MSEQANEQMLYRIALVVVTLAAIGTLVVGSEAETTLLMLSAVVAGLVCFDTAMNRQLHSRLPWLLISMAPVLKTVPIVWFELKANDGLLVERYDHAGSLLFGLCVLIAVVVLARPADSVGADIAVFDAAVIFGSALSAAAAGASVAFLFDRNFGSVRAGRLLETPTWFVIGASLAAIVLAAGHSRRLGAPLVALLLACASAVGLLAITAAGREIDRGWWALIFAGFALAAVAFGPAALGERHERDRLSNAGVVITLVVGLIAAASAISARSDPASWGPGWAILGVLSLAMFALALASRPIDEPVAAESAVAGPQDIGLPERAARTPIHDAQAAADAAQAKDRALMSLRSAAAERAQPQPESLAPTQVAADDAVSASTAGPTGTDRAAAAAPDFDEVVPLSRAQARRQAARERREARQGKPGRAADLPVQSEPVVQPEPATQPEPVVQPEPATQPEPVVQPEPATQPDPVVQPEPATQPDPVAQPEPAETPEPAAASTAVERVPRTAASSTEAGLSDSGLVATARAAAEVRETPGKQRHAIAPLGHAHHFDPATGLLSAAGLQHALGTAFATPRQAGHVTIMMFTIRDLDQIEQEHGRLASAAVTREVASRVRTLLPAGTGARFARAAYAVIFVGDLGEPNDTVQRLARVLLHLRAPVEGGAVGDKIDVVAGMAQCYEGEDVANFVQRANQGLARAVQTVEPTFVAMP